MSTMPTQFYGLMLADPWTLDDYTDITPFVTEWAGAVMGRQHELQLFQPGQVSIDLNNIGGWFNTWDTTGPFYNLLAPGDASAETADGTVNTAPVVSNWLAGTTSNLGILVGTPPGHHRRPDRVCRRGRRITRHGHDAGQLLRRDRGQVVLVHVLVPGRHGGIRPVLFDNRQVVHVWRRSHRRVGRDGHGHRQHVHLDQGLADRDGRSCHRGLRGVPILDHRSRHRGALVQPGRVVQLQPAVREHGMGTGPERSCAGSDDPGHGHLVGGRLPNMDYVRVQLDARLLAILEQVGHQLHRRARASGSLRPVLIGLRQPSPRGRGHVVLAARGRSGVGTGARLGTEQLAPGRIPRDVRPDLPDPHRRHDRGGLQVQQPSGPSGTGTGRRRSDARDRLYDPVRVRKPSTHFSTHRMARPSTSIPS